MLYLKSFNLPNKDREENTLMYDIRTYINGIYPYNIFPPKKLEEINFSPITIFYGGNGSGKSTLLHLLGGVDRPTKGKVFIDDVDIYAMDNDALAIFRRRQVGLIYQFYNLIPILDVEENITLPAKLDGAEVDKKHLNDLLETLGLENRKKHLPNELSGGQQQRVGIARAFATDPDIILMDEPFSALDPMTRSALQDELIRIQSRYKKTIIFVTHDMNEAIKIADKIAILNEGHVIQYDTPEKILKNPANDFVKNFVGPKKIWSSPEFIKVSDIMIEHPVTCNPEYSIFYCLNKMRMAKVDTLMVVDDKNVLLGILYADVFTNVSYEHNKAKDFIEKDFLVTHPEDSIVDLLDLIDREKITTMPVVDSKGHLKGLITRSTLLTYMSQQFIKGDE